MADILVIRSAYLVLDPGGSNEVDISAYAADYSADLGRSDIDVSVIQDAVDQTAKGTAKYTLAIGVRWPATLSTLFPKMVTFFQSNTSTTVQFRLSSGSESTNNPTFQAEVVINGFDLMANRNQSSGFNKTYPVNSIGYRTSGSGSFTAITPS